MPDLNERIERAGTLIKGLAGLLALLPGIAIMLGLVDIPPSLVDLVKYISFSISIVVVIAILLLSKSVERLSSKAAAALILGSAIAGSALATGYLTFANRHVIVLMGGDEDDRLIMPLRPSPAIEAIVAPYAGDYVEALETSIQKERLRQLMERESGGSIAVLVTLLVLGQSLLTIAVVGGAWKLTAGRQRRGRTGKPRAARRLSPE